MFPKFNASIPFQYRRSPGYRDPAAQRDQVDATPTCLSGARSVGVIATTVTITPSRATTRPAAVSFWVRAASVKTEPLLAPSPTAPRRQDDDLRPDPDHGPGARVTPALGR